MITKPPTTPPPQKVLGFIHQWGFSEYVLQDGVLPWYRRGDEQALPWDEVPTRVANELHADKQRLQIALNEVREERDRYKAERDRFAAVSPKRGFFTSTFWIQFGSTLALWAVANQSMLVDLADHLGPVGSQALNLGLSLAVVYTGSRYKSKRKELHMQSDEAKRAARLKLVGTQSPSVRLKW